MKLPSSLTCICTTPSPSSIPPPPAFLKVSFLLLILAVVSSSFPINMSLMNARRYSLHSYDDDAYNDDAYDTIDRRDIIILNKLPQLVNRVSNSRYIGETLSEDLNDALHLLRHSNSHYNNNNDNNNNTKTSSTTSSSLSNDALTSLSKITASLGRKGHRSLALLFIDAFNDRHPAALTKMAYLPLLSTLGRSGARAEYEDALARIAKAGEAGAEGRASSLLHGKATEMYLKMLVKRGEGEEALRILTGGVGGGGGVGVGGGGGVGGVGGGVGGVGGGGGVVVGGRGPSHFQSRYRHRITPACYSVLMSSLARTPGRHEIVLRLRSEADRLSKAENTEATARRQLDLRMSNAVRMSLVSNGRGEEAVSSLLGLAANASSSDGRRRSGVDGEIDLFAVDAVLPHLASGSRWVEGGFEVASSLFYAAVAAAGRDDAGGGPMRLRAAPPSW